MGVSAALSIIIKSLSSYVILSSLKTAVIFSENSSSNIVIFRL